MTRRGSLAALGITAVLTAVAAALGVFGRGSGAFETVVSSRGETYEMAIDGVYANSSRTLVAEGLGWDVFTLLVVVPALALAAWWVGRGSTRGLLVAGGLLAYTTYMYLEYAVTWAFGPIFPLHIAILAVSTAGLLAVASEFAGAYVGHGFAERFPRRAYAGLTLTMAAVLTVLWAARIADALGAAIPELAGETTMTVQALDLGLVVPISAVLAVAVLLRRRSAIVAAASFSVFFITMSAAIGSMMVSAWIMTGEPTVAPLATFTLATLAGLVVARRIFAGVPPIASTTPELRLSGARAP
jgi:hypothetical protein